MKGIIECITWMVDNRDKKITNGEEESYWSGHEFYSKCIEGEFAPVLMITNFVRFNEEWTEVVEPVTTAQAYNDCKDTGRMYKSCRNGYNQEATMDRNEMLDVRIRTEHCRPLILDIMWIPVD